MMCFTTVWMLVTVLAWRGSVSIHWSTKGLTAHETIHACTGQSISLPWNVVLTTGETITRVQWFFSGRSQEMIAILSHGSFLPLPAFSGRVELTVNQGLVLHHVQVLDSGNYSAEVTAQQADGDLVVMRRTAVVYVRDTLMTRDGILQVRMSPEASFDNVTQQWRAMLTCGTFLHASRPPFNATWTTPSTTSEVSDDYSNGQFLLFLTSLVSEGTYTCRIPAHPQATCSSDQPAEGGVVVDRMEVRLIIVESQLRGLVEENRQLKEQYQSVPQTSSAGEAHTIIMTRITTLSPEEPTQHVSFHVRLFTSVHLPTWTKLVMTDVVSNQGNAYSNVTGEFVAPYKGTYFFIASTAVYGRDHVANFFLMVDDQEVDYAYTNSGGGHSEGGAVHAVVDLNPGQTVWLRSYQNSYYLDGSTAFSGFLLYHYV